MLIITIQEQILIIASNISKYRAARNLTQDQLAEKAEISTSHLSNIESKRKNPSIPVLGQIAVALEVSVDSLVFESSIDGRIRDIELFLRDKPDSFIMSIDKMIRLCASEFLKMKM